MSNDVAVDSAEVKSVDEFSESRFTAVKYLCERNICLVKGPVKQEIFPFIF